MDFKQGAGILTTNHQPLTTTILNVQRLSTEDGPGIRTTVFFKGCSLRCGWCHNPESLLPQVQVHWLENRCIGCRTCLQVCPCGALHENDSGMRIDRDICDGCGLCAEACPANAMEQLGRQVTLEALLAELLKDRAYYQTSSGGVTASGGEPALQPAFTAALFEHLRQEGIHTALDTCGLCSQSALEADPAAYRSAAVRLEGDGSAAAPPVYGQR
jgi:pyruvate formate lyase activating enzyme